MKNSDYHSLKMQQRPLLLRRPLPPKLPKLPLYRKKIHTAKTGETEPPTVRFTEDETISFKRDKVSFLDAISRSESQAPVNIQNIFHDDHGQEGVATISAPQKSTSHVHWHIPDTPPASVFFPRHHYSASTRVFKKVSSQMESLRKSPKKQQRRQKIHADKKLGNILILSSSFSKSSHTSYASITPQFKQEHPESPPLPESPDYIDELLSPLRDLSATLLSPVPSSISTKPEIHFPRSVVMMSKVVLHVAQFPGTISLPTPELPRKPQRQSVIESIASENGKAETAPRLHEGSIRTRRIEPGAHVLHGEGFKTVVATHYETITAMVNLAIVNCQIHGRNALSLKGFFILHCPDLTPLASNLVYLNLSFNHLTHFPTEIFCLKKLQVVNLRNNPIKKIPSEIQQLKFLRIFSIAFNYISHLPSGFYALSHLEELDISYNEFTVISNEIQKLRSLERLNVDGNYLTSFPPGILKLNLIKIHFQNTFTHPRLWPENSWNDPQQLSQICSLFIVKNNLYKSYEVIPKEIQVLLKSTSKCDWCHGPKFGDGMRIIQSYEIFGVSQLPVMLHTCSPSCWKEIKESSVVSGGFPSRRVTFNVE